jgi:oligopeptide/dipeptide ABC transporter ATP-binding protein
MPQLGIRGEPLATIPGGPPLPWAMPEGCRFHPRCRYATDVCRAGAPALEEGSAGHFSRCLRRAEIDLVGAV